MLNCNVERRISEVKERRRCSLYPVLDTLVIFEDVVLPWREELGERERREERKERSES
jgi:hypothetical protein